MKTSKKITLRALTALLAVIMAFGSAIQIFAEANLSFDELLERYSPEQIEEMVDNDLTVPRNNADGPQMYIYDVATATADTVAEAKSILNGKGYAVLDQNVNQGSDGRPCLIGYKLTGDREKALTSLQIMEMSGGYEFINYRDFLEKKATGLESVLDGFIASCREMKRLVKEKNQMATYAYDTLNLLCVPDSAASKKGVPLGEYLISDSTTREDIKTLILVCQAGILSFINNLLATACSECVANPTPGERTAYVSDPDWVYNAAVAVFARIGNMTKTETDAMVSKYSAAAKTFSNAVKSAGDTEKRFLDEIIVHQIYTNPQKKKKTFQSVYDMLISGEPVPIGCFLEALPETVTADNFIAILTEFVADGEEQKIPKKVDALPDIISPWMRDMVDYINATPYNPYEETQADVIIGRNKDIASDNSAFIYFIENLIDTYRRQDAVIKQIETELGVTSATADVVEEYTRRINAANAEKAEGEEPEPEYLFYSGAYLILKSYKIAEKDWLVMSDGSKCSDLAEYFELIADATGKAQEALAYAFTSVLTDYQRYNAQTTGVSIFIINGILLHSDQNDIRARYEDSKQAITKAYGDAGYAADECTVWFGTNRDLLDTESLAMTSAAKRLEKTNKDLLGSYNSFLYRESVLKGVSEALEITGIAMGVAGVLWAGGAFGIYLANGVAITGISALVDAAAGLGAAGTVLSTAGLASAILGLVGFIFMVVLAVAMVVLLILSLTYDISDKYEIEYTDIPTVMLDCDLDANNAVANIMRYEVVRDAATGKPADLNDMENSGARRWLALYYSTDPVAGSPLVANPDNQNYFFGQTDNLTVPDKAIPISKFGYSTPYNFNAYDNDSDNAVYIFCYSENSVSYIEDRHTPGKYLCDIKISISKSQQMAQNYFSAMSGYSYLDENLTPWSEFYTYLGYSTTNNESYAVTDIRAEYASAATSVTWGDATYISAFDEEEAASLPHRTVLPQNVDSTNGGVYSTPFYYNIYFSRSAKVGDPILADSLKVVEDDINDADDGYEFIRWFSGGAFDFIAERSCLNIHDNTAHVFVEFAPEESKRIYNSKKIGNTDYLAGIAFIVNGVNYYNPSYVDEIADLLGYKVLHTNLTGDALNRIELDDIGGQKFLDKNGYEMSGTLILYAVTKNPKKAITDIGVFTGEAKGNGILNNNIVRNGIGFESAQIFANDYNKMHLSHAYITAYKDDEQYFRAEDTEWYDQGYKIKSRGLYTAGPQDGFPAIKLTDVVYSLKYNEVPTKDGANNGIYYLNTQNPAGKGLGTGWRSVHALEQYFYDEYDADGNLERTGTNLGISLDEKAGNGCTFYLFVRNVLPYTNGGAGGADNVAEATVIKRGAYIAKAEIVGSLSYDSAYDEARYSAMAYGQEIINPTNPLYTKAHERYNVMNENVIFMEGDGTDEYSDTCYYIVVSYQNTDTNAVASIRVAHQSADNALPATYELDYNGDGKNAVYKKGQSYATTIRPEKKSEEDDDDGGTEGPHMRDPNKNNAPTEGYVLYCASHTGQAVRLAVLDNGLEERPFPEYGRRFAETLDGGIFATGSRVSPTGGWIYEQAIAIYSPLGEFIYDIMMVKGETQEQMEFELGRHGYTQVIYYDVMGATCDSVMLGIKRQTSPIGAIQDLKVATADLGKTTKIDGLQYTRINEDSIAATQSTNDQVYLYYTVGVRNSVKVWGGRTALTNLGISFTLGNEKRGKTLTYWNGMIGSDVCPAGVTSTTTRLEVSNNTGAKGHLNKAQFDRKYDDINYSYGSRKAEEFRADHGYTWFVYTNNSGFCYSDYATLYKQKLATGTAEGDAKLWSASQININPTLVAVIIGVSVALLAGAGLTVFVTVRRKRKKNSQNVEGE